MRSRNDESKVVSHDHSVSPIGGPEAGHVTAGPDMADSTTGPTLRRGVVREDREGLRQLRPASRLGRD